MALPVPGQQLALLAVLFSAAAVAAAQPTTDELSASPAADNNSAPAGVGIKVSFRPRVAIVVGIFTMIFSLTFILLMYAKFCHPSSSPSPAASALVGGGETGGNNGAAAAAAAVGVPKQVIESLPFFRFATLRGARQGMECSVCLARFDDADLLRLLPRCHHAFHLDCVDRWLQSSASCPLCRTSVDADDATLGLKYPSSARIVFGGDALSSGRFDDAAAGTAGSGRDLLDIFVERVPGPDTKPQQQQQQVGDVDDEEEAISSSVALPPGQELDRHKHRIIVSDVVFKSRWSELNSADLIALDMEMLRSMSSSSGRFVFPPDSPYCPEYSNEAQQAPNNKEIAAAAEEEEEEEEEDEDGVVPTTSRKRLLKPVVVVDARLGGGCSSGSAVSASAARMISSGVRSMSEIVSLPRLRAAARERLSEEENRNRRWLPIARRTARWFAGRASRGQQQEEEEEHRAVHVVAAEHDDV